VILAFFFALMRQDQLTDFGEEPFLVQILELRKGRFELKLDFLHVGDGKITCASLQGMHDLEIYCSEVKDVNGL
jgi:hypothetical protein